MADPKPEAILPDYAHLAGCPQRPERVETSKVRRSDGTFALVARCCECGAQRVEDDTAHRRSHDARA
jgi:hypothetical protein